MFSPWNFKCPEEVNEKSTDRSLDSADASHCHCISCRGYPASNTMRQKTRTLGRRREWSSEGRIKPCWDSNWKPLSSAAAKSRKHGGGTLCLDLLERELWMWQCERTDLRSALVFCFGTKLIFIDVMMMWCGRWNFEIVMPSCLPHSSQGCTDWQLSGSQHTALTLKRYLKETEYVFASGRFPFTIQFKPREFMT
jgi:hypothetical protein